MGESFKAAWPTRPSLPIAVSLVIEELWGGATQVRPAAGLDFVSVGDETEALDEQQVFLEEHLAAASALDLAKFCLPEATVLTTVEVRVPRDDLPRRLDPEVPFALPCLVIPAGRDAWVLVLPLRLTLFVAQGESVDEVVRVEAARWLSARGVAGFDALGLLPAKARRLERLTVQVVRGGQAPPGRASSLREQVAAGRQQRRAAEVLATVGRLVRGATGGGEPRPLEGREAELRLLAALLDGTERASVALVGRAQTGKTALFMHWLARAAAEGRGRPVYATSGAQLIAGMSGLGQWQERVRRVFDAAHQLDAILYFDDLGDLFTERVDGWVDMAGAMKPYLDDARVRLVGELSPETADAAESRHAGFFSCLRRVVVEPLDPLATARAVRSIVAWSRRAEPHLPTLAPEAVEPLVDLVERYLPYATLPGKAVRLLDETRAAHERERGADGEPVVLRREHVEQVFSLSSGVPAFLLREDRSLDVGEVVERLALGVVGQPEATRAVAETVCVVKAGLQPRGKPLATLFFVGPTGVGKTELARSLATLLFGAPERLTRFDMSEFMDAEAASRLIRGTERAEGLLTRRVREQPFCVVLLDEIEKASPAVFDLLLQVCGDGRLTDARGNTASFQNAIVIMTSNLGATHQRDGAGFLGSTEGDHAHYTRQIERSFRPEFVNRIDRVVVFRPLARADAAHVVRAALERLRGRQGLVEASVELRVSEAAIEHLAAGGYSASYGARALRRHLEDHLVSPVARLLASLGADGRESIVDVAVVDEPRTRALESALRESTHQGLRFVVIERPGGAVDEQRVMREISTLRRDWSRVLRGRRVELVREQIEFLVAQITHAAGGRGDRRQVAQMSELQIEHHDLTACHGEAVAAFRDLEAVEDLAMTALFEGTALAPLRDEACALVRRLERAVARVLLAQEPRRDACALLLQELDGGRTLDAYLPPFFEEAARRGWAVTLHVDRDKAPGDPTWPAFRRWGPPRDGEQVSAWLRAVDRPASSVVLRCRGPYAGVLLALERGVHRFHGARGDEGAGLLLVRLVSMRDALDEHAWAARALEPVLPDAMAEARRGGDVRLVKGGNGGNVSNVSNRMVVDPRTAGPARVALASYWADLERLNLDWLLRFERDAESDRDALFVGELDVDAGAP